MVSSLREVSQEIGVPEPALRFLCCLLLPYVVSAVYRLIAGPSFSTKPISNTKALLKNLYFFVTGISILYFGFGRDTNFLLIQVVVSYVIACVLGSYNRLIGLLLTFFGNLFGLLTAYYFYSSVDSYDIDWTTPACVLVLRLSGFAFDFYDGGQPKDKLSAEEAENAIRSRPSFIGVLGYAFFPCSIMAGPYFTYRKYEKFINNELMKLPPATANDKTPQPRPPSVSDLTAVPFLTILGRFLLGAVYLASYNVLTQFGVSSLKGEAFLSGRPASDSIFASVFDSSANASIISQNLYRFTHLFFFARYSLQKYIGVWLIVDGAVILSGIGFGGYQVDAHSGSLKVKWDGLTNINAWAYETATNVRQVVPAFNINTNDWVRRYIYVRLTKLKVTPQLGQLTVLFYLAVWHGFAPGYFLCFFMEFISLMSHLKLAALTSPLTTWMYNGEVRPGAPPPDYRKDNILKKILRPIYAILCYVAVVYSMSWGIIAFELKVFDETWQIYKLLHYVGFIALVLAFLPVGSKKPSRKPSDKPSEKPSEKPTEKKE